MTTQSGSPERLAIVCNKKFAVNNENQISVFVVFPVDGKIVNLVSVGALSTSSSGAVAQNVYFVAVQVLVRVPVIAIEFSSTKSRGQAETKHCKGIPRKKGKRCSKRGFGSSTRALTNQILLALRMER